MRPRCNASAGFTLIELLIVVAIISILSAIAVPNYLHAQLRAKVSRVKGDMYSVSVAVEAYMADYGVYPPTQDRAYSLDASWIVTGGLRSGYRLLPVTTPIPYIKHLYTDPFSYVQGRKAGEALGPNLPPVQNFTTEPIPYCWRNLTEILVNGVVVHNPIAAQQPYFTHLTGQYPVWVMFSFGPDLDYRGGYLDPTYDPSNGLFSDGDVFLLGPGYGFVNKRAG